MSSINIWGDLGITENRSCLIFSRSVSDKRSVRTIRSLWLAQTSFFHLLKILIISPFWTRLSMHKCQWQCKNFFPVLLVLEVGPKKRFGNGICLSGNSSCSSFLYWQVKKWRKSITSCLLKQILGNFNPIKSSAFVGLISKLTRFATYSNLCSIGISAQLIVSFKFIKKHSNHVDHKQVQSSKVWEKYRWQKRRNSKFN